MDSTMWKALHSDVTGKEFETDMIGALRHQFQDSRIYRIRNMGGTRMDKEEGTDFLCGEIRLDATMNFSDKDTMPFIADTGIPATKMQNFLVGVRHGNTYRGYTGFPQPVIVIGVDMDSYTYHQCDNEVIANAEKHAEELMDFASDCLEDYLTVDAEERLDLYRTPLRPNPSYKEPKNIEPKYAQSNRVRRLPKLPSSATNAAYDTEHLPQ